jgi:hypothetical protein
MKGKPMPRQHLPQPGTYIPVPHGNDVVSVLVIAIAKHPETGRIRLCVLDTTPKWISAEFLATSGLPACWLMKKNGMHNREERIL